jgi:hypothetical protein
VKARSIPVLARSRAPGGGASAGLRLTVRQVDVPFPELDPDDLVTWRLGMAQVAPFVARAGPTAPACTTARLELLGPDPELLVRRMIVLTVTT